MALWTGSPVSRFHTMVVSRWLVMPMAATSLGLRAGFEQGLQRHCDLRRRDLLGIVLDPPGLRKDLIEFALRDGADRAFLIEQESARTGCALIER